MLARLCALEVDQARVSDAELGHLVAALLCLRRLWLSGCEAIAALTGGAIGGACWAAWAWCGSSSCRPCRASRGGGGGCARRAVGGGAARRGAAVAASTPTPSTTIGLGDTWSRRRSDNPRATWCGCGGVVEWMVLAAVRAAGEAGETGGAQSEKRRDCARRGGAARGRGRGAAWARSTAACPCGGGRRQRRAAAAGGRQCRWRAAATTARWSAGGQVEQLFSAVTGDLGSAGSEARGRRACRRRRWR
ncbi:MAG: hypothetical protein IV100_20825 [Myxococcales bacterium]|nr:hypothetical protein [Myxococcales bacterium]